MNKSQLIEELSMQTGLTKVHAEKVLSSIFNVVGDEIKSGGVVKIVGFGTFDSVTLGERNGHNPKTGQPLLISSKRKMRFKPGLTFKKILDSSKK